MKAYKWTQTIINFEYYYKSKIEIEYHKSYKSIERFYALSKFNKFVTRKSNFNKWFSNYKRIDNKIKEKEIINKYVRKIYLGCN